MTELTAAEPVFAPLADGVQVEIRPLVQADRDAVRGLHRSLSPDSLYARFFGLGAAAADQAAERLCRGTGPGRAALGAWLRGELVGVGEFDPTGTPGEAEVAFAVADRMQHHGVGTLLLERLVELARARGIGVFRADVLASNAAMLRVFADAGLDVRSRVSAGVVEAAISLDGGERYRAAVADRASRADVASLVPLLRPRSVAVVGTAPDVLRSLTSGGFAGTVHAVNPHAAGRVTRGAPCVATPAELPVPPDLVVLSVPAVSVADAAAACGRRGARAVVVLTGGLNHGQDRALRDACHAWGMRLVGPGSSGVAHPLIGLHATAVRRPAGSVGVVAGTGGAALLDGLARIGAGVSTFAGVGAAADVCAADLLRWWAADPATRLGVLGPGTSGDPGTLARAARRVPLLALGAPAEPFARAGIVAVGTLDDLLDVAALLARQPFPRGPRVAVVERGHETAAVCAAAGLTVTARAAGLDARAFRKLADDGDVDAVLIALPVRPGVVAACGKPVLAVRPGQAGTVGVPSYAAPERAARALARAWSAVRRADG
ncbi:Acetyltransferase Pat [Actinomadura rubteroloni]|uniref:Acetyltransferase Pat n=1 Tax=Actinomadura rubteroloni TaxID=1926885 RepID=A0A2P4UER9_9ACTN|nr:GNAT family N-acetyltransferase [Actinomadura rubteroloni]POM23553.1 Acetyltransferase Pat [Actinomadura rubteroloni]